MLQGKHIILGVTGGIAAYKTAYLVREFVKSGAEVQVVMTPAAAEFVTPLTLATLSRRPVVSEIFPREQSTHWTQHIDLALWADVMLVAPATANTLAKLAHGLADNFLTSLVLALRAPLVLAPAMDMDMYRHPATQTNLQILRQRGCVVLEPESGELASGLSGPGRLPEIDTLVNAVDALLGDGRVDLTGRNVVVTAGPTHEPIDPVRYVGNRSSGKMGYAIAQVAAQRGAQVTLISGPVALATPPNVHRINVETAAGMFDAVKKVLPSADALIMAAAVSDFAPAHIAEQKIKREAAGAGLTLDLSSNPDILKYAGDHRRKGQVLVGFALETENGVANAQKKLVTKQLDLIVLNDPGEDGAGFGVDTNIVTLIAPGNSMEKLPRLDKHAVAEVILAQVKDMLGAPRKVLEVPGAISKNTSRM